MQRCLLTTDVVGRRTAYDVLAPEGAGMLMPAGVRLGPQHVQALAARGVRHVFLQDELFPDLPDVHTVPVATCLKAQAAVREVTAALATPRSQPAAVEAQHLMRAAREIVEEVLAADAMIADLGPWGQGGLDPVEHTVHVAAISVQIGRYYPLPRDQLLRLCVGALLMDVGLGHLGHDVLLRPGTLDRTGLRAMLDHPRSGWELVHRWLPAVLPTSASVVLQHHERLDGSGYPEGREGADIYLFARLVAVADVFAAVRANRPHRRRFAPAEMERLLREEAGVGLDQAGCDLLMRHVALVPHGSIVRLSDGTLAKVVAHSPGAPLQPLCVVVGDALDQKVRRRQFNLRGTNLYVEKILDAWPPALLASVQRSAPWEGA